MVSCLPCHHTLVELASLVLLVWIGQIQCLIDKKKDLEGLVTDSSIDTHEIPLKYDLFRDRVLPELLQTVPDDIMEDYINQIPEVDVTIDTRHTTIVYRHDHLYYTAPHDLYRKLRYYKWKFRSRRRRTTPTPEPSFTLNEEDFLELRNQVKMVVTEKHEIVDPNDPPTMWFTRNTGTPVYPAQRLHSVILKKQFFDKKVPDSYYDDQFDYAQGRVTNPLLELVGMTFNTVFRTMRRLNRTVTFIPFRIGSWRTSSWYPVTTAYYMYPNYTLPTHRTRATDMYDYDKPIFAMVTSKPFAILDEEENRKRFSLAIVERMKQREMQIAMRTVNTSYLKFVMKPYKYPTVLVGPTLPPTPAPHYPGYKQWFTKEAPSIVTHSIEVLKGSKNHTVKMMKMDLDLEDDLFDMDINDLVIEPKIKTSDTDLLCRTTESVHDRTTTNSSANIDEGTTNMEYFEKEAKSKIDNKLLGGITTAKRNDNAENPTNENNGNIDDILWDKNENIKKNEDSFNYTDKIETPQTEIKATKKRARKGKRTTKGKRKRNDKTLSDENEDIKDEAEVGVNDIYDDNVNDNYDRNCLGIKKNEDSFNNTDKSETPQTEIKATKKRARKGKRTTKGKRKRKLSDENEDTKDEAEVSVNDIYDDNINDNYDSINGAEHENDNSNYNKDGDTQTHTDCTAPKKRGQKKVNVVSKLLNNYEQRKRPVHHVEKRSPNTTRVYRDGSKEEEKRSPNTTRVYRDGSKEEEKRSPNTTRVYRDGSKEEEKRSPNTRRVYRDGSKEEEKRSPNTTRVYRDGSKEEVVTNTTKRIYSNFKSLLLKKLSRTKSTKKISTYTFRTRKIPIIKRKTFISGITSNTCETTHMGVPSTEKTTKLKAANRNTENTITGKSSTRGLTNLRFKSKTSERKGTTKTTKLMTSTQSVPQKQQRKKASVKPTKQKTQEEIQGEYLLFNGDRKDPFEEVKKGKTRKKSKAERQEELLHMLYPPVTLHDRKENQDKYRDQHKDYSKHHGKLAPGKPFDESEGSEKKPKRRKKINEEEEEFLNQIYQPVTVNEEWVKEYERGLRPTIPQNMSKHDYVRGFYTYGTSDEKVETCATTSFSDTTLNNQAGYFPKDTNLFSSQEKIKFQEVINMYNKYAKQFLQEAISTRKSRKKTAETTTLEVNTEGAVMFAMEQILRRNWTRPFIQCNWSNFVYY